MTIGKRILIIDFCNYQDYPIGGYLTFAKNMMVSFGNDLALVGITTDENDKIGSWIKKEINGVSYDFFALAYYSKTKTKHIVPDRLVSYYMIRYFKKEILNIGITNVFIQRQEVLQAVEKFGFGNICYCFAGMENPLAISKYWYAQHIARYFERSFFGKLKSAKSILASGDELAIAEMIERSNGIIERSKVIQFPSRINTDIFTEGDKVTCRLKLNIPQDAKIIITTGRLAWLKGWKFMIDCYNEYAKHHSNSLFYFIGEGEDRAKIEDYLIEKELVGKVILAGKKSPQEVAEYLNASDLFIMGSYKEGWSTALIEAIACGLPCCVTNFSSAKDIIKESLNGFVSDDHNIDSFVLLMNKASEISLPVYNENVKAYAANRLKQDLLTNWELI